MKTIIQIEKETAIDLKKLKIDKLETYDEIIRRLIKNAGKTKNCSTNTNIQ